MSSTGVITRFAPSPTGDIHIGNARTALFSALLAKRHGGRFLLRIEDTDRERSRAEHVDALIEDLRWLGLRWDAGPGCGSKDADAAYFQSNRGTLYQRYFEDLAARELAYPCFCTPADLEQERVRQRGDAQAPRYSGRCRGLAASERRERLEREPAALRFAVAGTGTLEFDDLVRGPQTFRAADIGDFVIRRSDGTPAFFFSNAIDDALMNVTHVLRGEDHLANTPRQIMILRALALPVPHYGHLGLIVDEHGAPLSKRRGDISLRALRARGYLADAVVNYLARLGRSGIDDGLWDLEGLARGFEERALARGPARFDETQLHHWQRQALQKIDAAGLWDWLDEETRARVPTDQREAFLRMVRGNVSDPGAARQLAHTLFSEVFDMAADAQHAIDTAADRFFCRAVDAVDRCGADFACLRGALMDLTGLRGRALFAPLRAAVTGGLEGPEMAQLLSVMGAQRVRARLLRWCHE
ncbi:MAG: glutamate--tRNA ligase [Acidiferrobacteraceae bacterium]